MFLIKKHNTKSNDFRSAEGFEKVYSAHAEKMYLIGVSKTQDEEATKEIIQEIFKSLWERRETLEINSSIEHYLMRALKLKIIDHYRVKAAQRIREEELLKEHCDYSNCTEETLDYEELHDNVEKLVDRLSCQCRKVYKMKHEQNLNNKEIASALLISERAVAYHLANAKRYLQEELKHLVPS